MVSEKYQKIKRKHDSRNYAIPGLVKRKRILLKFREGVMP